MITEFIPTVGVVVLKGNSVLLIRHEEGADNPNGVFGIPSGRLKPGESEVLAAVRELKEETGLQTEASHLKEFPNNLYFAKLPRKDGSVLNCSWRVFRCMQWSGDLTSSEETTPDWVQLPLPENMTLMPNIKEVIQIAQKLENN